MPRAVIELSQRLQAGGHRAWVVGGCVRDSLLGQLEDRAPAGSWIAKDWDIATDAAPERVSQLFRRVVPTGIEHGTVTVILHDLPLEVTTLRADKSYGDGRRPDQVDFVHSIDEDLARRDFTVNAIAFDPATEVVVDPFDGLGDLRRRRLRAVGEPARRFAEDGLRVLRAARFVATLEFELDPETALAIRPSLDTYRKVSAERIREEWQKTLRAREPSRGFRVMHEHGLLALTAPELSTLDPGAQLSEPASGHIEAPSRLRRVLERVDRCPPRPELRLAALLGDVEAEPARAALLADALLARLRYSNAERKWVTRLIRARDLPTQPRRTDAELRRWLREAGPDLYSDLCSIARADANSLPQAEHRERRLAAIDELQERADALLAQNPPLSLADLALNGQQLMAHAGLRPGPGVGRTLEALLEIVIEDPNANTPERLLEHARSLVVQPPVSSSNACGKS